MNILVVDDEPLACERLLRLLQKLRPESRLRGASSGEEALRLAREEVPDLVFLDIRMPGMDGIEVAEALNNTEQPPAVVFCTAYDQYALDALQRNAAGYLLKPVRPAELEKSLAEAGRLNRLQLARLMEAEDSRSEVSSHGHRGIETLPVAQVRCFVAGDKYVTAHAPRGELVLQDTLKELESEFAPRFLRVHRNALVSLEHVLRLSRDRDGGWRVELDGVDVSPAISRRHLADVKRALLQR